LTPAYAQSLSTPTMSLRLSQELPPTMATWFQVLAIGNQQIALRLPNFNDITIAIKTYFSNPPKILTTQPSLSGSPTNVATAKAS